MGLLNWPRISDIQFPKLYYGNIPASTFFLEIQDMQDQHSSKKTSFCQKKNKRKGILEKYFQFFKMFFEHIQGSKIDLKKGISKNL